MKKLISIICLGLSLLCGSALADPWMQGLMLSKTSAAPGIFFAWGNIVTNDQTGTVDGVTWTAQSTPTACVTSNTNHAIAWGNSLFTAASAPASAVGCSSPDGVNWTLRTMPTTETWKAMAWNGTIFCALSSSSNNGAKSSNSTSWTTETTGSSKNGAVDIVWNGSIFVVVAKGNQEEIDTSADCVSWNIYTTALPSNEGWSVIKWNGSIFVALNNTDNTYSSASSSDGVTWTGHTSLASANWTAIAWSGSVFCAVNNNQGANDIASSSNGTTWVSHTSGVTDSWRGVTWNGSIFAAAGTVNGYIITSPDCVTWTQQTSASAVNDTIVSQWLQFGSY